jgi:hypothetical protein
VTDLKPKKCKSCGELFKPFSSLAKVCSMACSLDFVGKEKQKLSDKAHREKKKTFLENDKSFQRSKAQKAFNEYIRLRDATLGCISCDKPSDWGGQWHAGHYKTVGARPDLRFNEDNCHKQCSVCNNFLSGNLAQYRIALLSKIGSPRVLMLDTDGESPKKYMAKDYAYIHAEYSTKIKEMKNANN